jgi:hypothetical protein
MKRLLLLAGALAAGPLTASAQSADQIGTYVAISRTPVGALAPMLTNTLINRLQNGASLGLRYGYLQSADNLNATNHAVGITGVLPAGLGASLRLTAGFNMTDCVDCDPDLLLGAGGDIRLIGSAMGNTASSPLWTVSLDGELGYSNLNPGSAFSGYVGAPIALVQRGQGMQFAPFITPGFAFAQTNGAPVSSTSGSGLMIGGGLGIYNSESSVVINAGGQHFFMRGARSTIGINILFGGK